MANKAPEMWFAQWRVWFTDTSCIAVVEPTASTVRMTVSLRSPVGEHTVDIAPRTVTITAEPAALVQDLPPAVGDVLRAELDDARRIRGPAGLGIHDLQPAPDDGVIQFQCARTRFPVPAG